MLLQHGFQRLDVTDGIPENLNFGKSLVGGCRRLLAKDLEGLIYLTGGGGGGGGQSYVIRQTALCDRSSARHVHTFLNLFLSLIVAAILRSTLTVFLLQVLHAHIRQ